MTESRPEPKSNEAAVVRANAFDQLAARFTGLYDLGIMLHPLWGPRLRKAQGAPQVLPVLTRATKEEVKRAEKAYDVVLNAPSKNRVFVDGVDDAMDVHAFEMAEAAKAAKRSTR